MEKYYILVEGKADVTFIRDYLQFLYEDLELLKEKSKNKSKEKELKNETTHIKIEAVGGYTTIKKHLKSKLEELKDFNYKIFVIQDADNPQKQDGGVIDRMKYLEKIKNDLNIDFKIFLFPDNKNDGDLETLLLKIVKEEKFNQTLDCYKKYAECANNIDSSWTKEFLENKNVVYNYFRIYKGMTGAKEENRKFSSDYWDFNNEALKPLKAFFINIKSK